MPQQPAGFVADVGKPPEGFQPEAKPYTPAAIMVRDATGHVRPIDPNAQVNSSPDLKTQLGMALEPLAQPHTWSDIAGLVLPNSLTATIGERAAWKAASDAARAVGRGGVKAAAAVADTVDPLVVGMYSPRAASALRLAQRTRNAMASGAPASDEVARLGALGVERYGAPQATSVADAGSAAADASHIASPPQATWTKLPDDKWGIVGRGLEVGQPVHVVKGPGLGEMHQVTSIVEDVNGIQTAKVTPLTAPLQRPPLNVTVPPEMQGPPSAAMPQPAFRGTPGGPLPAPKPFFDADTVAKIQILVKSGMSQGEAIRMALSLKSGMM